jgi:hypothetical protein
MRASTKAINTRTYQTIASSKRMKLIEHEVVLNQQGQN